MDKNISGPPAGLPLTPSSSSLEPDFTPEEQAIISRALAASPMMWEPTREVLAPLAAKICWALGGVIAAVSVIVVLTQNSIVCSEVQCSLSAVTGIGVGVAGLMAGAGLFGVGNRYRNKARTRQSVPELAAFLGESADLGHER